MTRIALVVDDDAVSRLVLCHMLRTEGWEVGQASDVGDAVDEVSATAYDLVISDFHLPSGTGIDVFDAAERSATPPAFVLVTGIIEYSSLASGVAHRIGAQLTKPVSSQTLRAALERLFPPGSP